MYALPEYALLATNLIVIGQREYTVYILDYVILWDLTPPNLKPESKFVHQVEHLFLQATAPLLCSYT